MEYLKNHHYKVIAIVFWFGLLPCLAFSQKKTKQNPIHIKSEQIKAVLFEKIFTTKRSDSVPIYLNLFLKRYPEAFKDFKYRPDALYGRLAERMANEKKWKQYEIYRAKMSSAEAIDLDYWTAIESLRSNSELQVAERLAIRALNAYENANRADLPANGKPDSVFIKNEQDRAKGINKRLYRNGKPDSTLVNNEKIRKYGSLLRLCAELSYINKHEASGIPYALKAQNIIGDSASELYLKLLAHTAAPATALAAIEAHYKKGNVNDDELPGIVAILYKKIHPSGDGFKEYYQALHNQLLVAAKEKINREKLSMPAPDFNLLNMKGEEVKLSDLEGKIVVIDFWATWCIYCKKGFPAMQKMMDKYSSNKVVFLFINTQETLNDANRNKQIKDYMSKNKYNFNVLLDTKKGVDYDVVMAYKVDGLPTKFVIDKNGNIAFKDVGYSGSDEKLMNDLSAMIELSM